VSSVQLPGLAGGEVAFARAADPGPRTHRPWRPLSRDAARRAIEQLVREWNARHPDHPVSIEPQLVEAVLDAERQDSRVSIADLVDRCACPVDAVNAVLSELEQGRLVRALPAAPGLDPIRYRRYEIFHEVLVPPIRSWVLGQRTRGAEGPQTRRRWSLSR
jgi:hypothetical protein